MPAENPSPCAHRGAEEAELWARAERVFGSPVDAEEFPTTPHALPEGRSPPAFATTAGARRSEVLLWPPEYSLPV